MFVCTSVSEKTSLSWPSVVAKPGLKFSAFSLGILLGPFPGTVLVFGWLMFMNTSTFHFLSLLICRRPALSFVHVGNHLPVLAHSPSGVTTVTVHEMYCTVVMSSYKQGYFLFLFLFLFFVFVIILILIYILICILVHNRVNNEGSTKHRKILK